MAWIVHRDLIGVRYARSRLAAEPERQEPRESTPGEVHRLGAAHGAAFIVLILRPCITTLKLWNVCRYTQKSNIHV